MVNYMAINVTKLLISPLTVKITSLLIKICVSHKFSLSLSPYSTCSQSTLRAQSPRVEVVIR